MNRKRITLPYYHDPGHGWIRVPIEVVADLDIVERISPFSYMTPDAVFLEEDRDGGVLMDAACAAGLTVTLRSHHTNRVSRIRGYASFEHHWVACPLAVGSHFLLVADNAPGRILTFERFRIVLVMDDGMTYQCPPARILSAIRPPATASALAA